MITRQTKLASHFKEQIDAHCDEFGITLTEFFTDAIRSFVANGTETAVFRAVPTQTPALHVYFDETLLGELKKLVTKHQVSLSAVLYTAICQHAQTKGIFQ